MKKQLATLALLLFTSASMAVAEIPRDGNLRMPSTEELEQECKENSINNTNKRIAYCVLSELEGAEAVIKMIADDQGAASQAYWDCVDTPEINSFALLRACMAQELGILPKAISVTDDNS